VAAQHLKAMAISVAGSAGARDRRGESAAPPRRCGLAAVKHRVAHPKEASLTELGLFGRHPAMGMLIRV
jgi:hypothetical protein